MLESILTPIVLFMMFMLMYGLGYMNGRASTGHKVKKYKYPDRF